MKKLILRVSLFCIAVFAFDNLNGQILNVSLGDYKECIQFCRGLSNSEEIRICMEGCRSVESNLTNLTMTDLNRAFNLKPKVNQRQLKEGENLVYSDAKTGLQYFALSFKNSLVGYKVKDRSGKFVPSRLVKVETKQEVKCYIFVGDKLVEVTCPDVIIVTEAKNLKIKQ